MEVVGSVAVIAKLVISLEAGDGGSSPSEYAPSSESSLSKVGRRERMTKYNATGNAKTQRGGHIVERTALLHFSTQYKY